MGIQPSDALLTDRVAIVTGAGQGIGAAVATTLADFGAHLVICDHNCATLETVAEKVRATGRTVRGSPLNWPCAADQPRPTSHAPTALAVSSDKGHGHHVAA